MASSSRNDIKCGGLCADRAIKCGSRVLFQFLRISMPKPIAKPKPRVKGVKKPKPNSKFHNRSTLLHPNEVESKNMCRFNFYFVVLGGCGILNSVLVFSCPKTSVSGSALALKYTKIGKVYAIRILSPGLHINPHILCHHDFLPPSLERSVCRVILGHLNSRNSLKMVKLRWIMTTFSFGCMI